MWRSTQSILQGARTSGVCLPYSCFSLKPSLPSHKDMWLALMGLLPSDTLKG